MTTQQTYHARNYSKAKDWEIVEAVKRFGDTEALAEATRRNLTIPSPTPNTPVKGIFWCR